MKLKSYGDIIVVKRHPKQKITDSGIHLPDKYGDNLSMGNVVSGGEHISEGTKIVYNSMGAMELDGQDLIHKQSILSIIED